MNNDLIARLELAMRGPDRDYISLPYEWGIQAITALREYKDANMKAAILHGEDEQRIAELESQLNAAEKLCKIYFEIAEDEIGEDAEQLIREEVDKRIRGSDE